jgi:CheY-like chemotaxis protein
MSAVRKILVVDDDPIVGKSFDRVLTRRGYLVVNAENGLEALNKLANEEYDAVFTDIKMPGMDGIEVAERVRAKRPWTPVVIITGYGSADNEARAEAAGVSGFLRKPLSPETIESSLAEVVAAAVSPTAEMALSGGVAAAAEAGAAALAAPPAAAGESKADGGAGRFAKNAALLFAAPFIGLAFIAFFPIVGLAMLAWMGAAAWRKRHAAMVETAAVEPTAEPTATGEAKVAGGVGMFVKNIALFFAAPFIALLYIALFPIVGLAMLAWTGGRAWRERGISG